MNATKIDEQLAKLVEEIQYPVSSLVAIAFKNGRRIYEGAFGNVHIDPAETLKPKKVTLNTKFRIASISKWVMTLALMRLLEDGTLDLYADVGQYLNFGLRNPSLPATPITLRHLLSHTSTIDDANAYSIPLPYGIESFFEPDGRFYENGAHFVSGQQIGQYFNYSNLNYGIAATLMERVTKRRFDRLMTKLIFDPLSLSATHNVSDFDQEGLKELAPLYRLIEGRWVAQVDDYSVVSPLPLRPVENPDRDRLPDNQLATLDHQGDLSDYSVGTNGTLFSPQGGLRISANGLATLMSLIFEEKTEELGITPGRLREMQLPIWEFDAKNGVGENYGGLMRSWGLSTQRFTHFGNGPSGDRFLPDSPSKTIWFGHLGDAYGLLSGFFYEPESKNGLITIIGGTPEDVGVYPGRYSSFNGWEEDIFKTIFPFLI